MDTAILPSTLLLTLLLTVGLFFFIRASTKDRTETVQLVSDQNEATLMSQLKDYFSSRSYQVVAVDREKNQVTFAGFVRPSWFLAIFLTLLALIGFLCLSLVLSLLFPGVSKFSLGLLLFSPLSGWFYWQKSGRLEKVLLQMQANGDEQTSSSRFTVTAHRDELAELQKALQLTSK
ncbi:MAG TPA: cofactor assembly of complex C subunit B [Nostocaceae cyanobacterium]|nr:cofactor assembly of complex C subunit B [Nostocaceae cyanobacterium]